jgi:hypothetical protein
MLAFIDRLSAAPTDMREEVLASGGELFTDGVDKTGRAENWGDFR